MLREDALNIHTDGSSYSGPRVGGIGIRFVTINELGDEIVEDIPVPGYKGATNNQMELYACVEALKETQRYQDLGSVNSVEIFTDSQYIVNNHTSAMFQWGGEQVEKSRRKAGSQC